MAKHINWEMKYQYVKRYLNSENPQLLGYELTIQKLTNDIKPEACIFRWYRVYKYQGLFGLKGLGEKAKGRKPKK